MLESLEDVLADERGQAAVLRHNGHGAEAEKIERVCERVARAMAEYLTWLSEDDAMLRSGKPAAFFRRQFPEWEAVGDAKKVGRRRYYRASRIPQGLDLHAVREAALRGERPQ